MKNKIVLAPVGKNNPQAQEHLAFELYEASCFRPPMWDGEVNGKDQAGDLFGWVDQVADTITVTRVLLVLSSSAARRHWTSSHSLRANHATKNTLILDPFTRTISYSKYKKDAGYKDNLVLNGTKRLIWPY